MLLKRGQWPILIVNLIYLAFALYFYSARQNYEFVMYVGVIILALVLILLTNNKIDYPNTLLWGLTVWGLMHMLGGGLLIDNSSRVLYTWIIIPISETYGIFRYDQLVHIIGFFVATILMYVLLKPNMSKKFGWWSTGIVLAMAGLGVGALNEIIEFIATVLVPETGVGGFINTALDLVADLIGSVLAVLFIRYKSGKLK